MRASSPGVGDGVVSRTVRPTTDGSSRSSLATRSCSRTISGNDVSSDASVEIELSTKQQTLAVEQVNMVVAEVARSAKEAEVCLTQTLLTVSQLASLSRDLARLVHVEGGAP